MAALTQNEIEKFTDTMISNLPKNKVSYARQVYDSILNDLSFNDEDHFNLAVNTILPIARYAIEFTNMPPHELSEKLNNYAHEHIIFNTTDIQIILTEEQKNKYPVSDDLTSKLSVLACEFVKDLKKH